MQLKIQKVNCHKKRKKGKLPRASDGKTKWSHEGCDPDDKLRISSITIFYIENLSH